MFNVTQAQLCLLGFVIGVFPVVVWRVIRSLTTKLFVFAVPNLESKFTLDGLDGLTVWHQSRLEEEDIENIPNMATADIVDLLVNTRLPAGRIIDWVDQAILLTYLRESSTGIRPGRRGACASRSPYCEFAVERRRRARRTVRTPRRPALAWTFRR